MSIFKLFHSRKFAHNIFVRKLWGGFVRVTNSHYIRSVLIKSLNLESTHPINSTVFPKISLSNSSKNVLVVMPFYGADAVGKNIDTKINTFKSLGYTIHVVIYNDSVWDSHNEEWDYTYNIKSTNKDFGSLNVDVNNQIIPDGNKVDDWVDDEFCQFIAALSSMNKFDIAIINYVFLSKVCLFLDELTIKIIDTHDVFAERNTRMSKVGVTKDKYYFSTNKDEESRGLSRSDYIFAIQESEGEYFNNTVDSKVIVQPPVLDEVFVNYMPISNDSLVVGFIASGHYPNVVAIKNFIECLSLFEHDIILNISGTICHELNDHQFPRYVRVLGFCEHLEDFYKSCDLIVNPDELLSGLKVKCLEALSYGIPLVATYASMEGIQSSSDYHKFKTAKDCAYFISSLEKADLQSMANVSRDIFGEFNSLYNLESTINKVLNEKV